MLSKYWGGSFDAIRGLPTLRFGYRAATRPMLCMVGRRSIGRGMPKLRRLTHGRSEAESGLVAEGESPRSPESAKSKNTTKHPKTPHYKEPSGHASQPTTTFVHAWWDGLRALKYVHNSTPHPRTKRSGVRPCSRG